MAKKYKKSKNYKMKKKAYKKSKKKQKSYTTRILFPSGKSTLPDRLHVTLYANLGFVSAPAVGTGGEAAYFNVQGMTLPNPFIDSATTRWQSYTAAVGGAHGGFGGTLLPGYNTQTTPAFFAQLMDLYRYYYVKASSISVNMDIDEFADEGDVCIRPGNNLDPNTSSFKNACQSRFAKVGQVGFYQHGAKSANKVSNYISTAKVLGYPIGDDKMTLEGGFIGTATTDPGSEWSWQVLYQCRYPRATDAGISVKVYMTYHVILFQPQLTQS